MKALLNYKGLLMVLYDLADYRARPQGEWKDLHVLHSPYGVEKATCSTWLAPW